MSATSTPWALRGEVLRWGGDPFHTPPEQAIRFETDGAVVIQDGVIQAVGPAETTLAAYPGVPVTRCGDKLILPGFVDCHTHYPQTEIIASYGAQLLDWLNTYTFPEELRFADPAHAHRIAGRFLDTLARHGTTSASVYCTVHPESVEALFEAAAARNLRLAAGKMMMDRHAPEGLTDTPQTGYEHSKALLERWHGQNRLAYAISPRFAPTSTQDQLEAAGALWAEHPGALMQTHISENHKEIAWVADLFPEARDYLDVYQRAGLTGPGANFGHAIHLSDRECAALRETGAGVSHCPTSNLFIGSGLCDVHGLRAEGIPVGLATDVGGGSSFSMLTTMKAAYEIAQLRGVSLHPAQAYHLATQGSAQVMRMADKIGDLAPGLEADITILDPDATPILAARTRRADSISDLLFALMILGDDRAVWRTYSGGALIHDRDKADTLRATQLEEHRSSS